MKKTLCLFPKDQTTEFLRPIYDALCQTEGVIGFDSDAIEDDDYFEKLELLLKDTNSLIFLGHGSSCSLFGTNLNPIIDNESGNLDYLMNKKLLLFSCKSADFIDRYKLHDALGFGFIPTSKDDALGGAKLHKLDISILDYHDLDIFKDAIVRIWLRTLKKTDWSNTHMFMSNMSFFTNIEITNILTKHKDEPNHRLIADMLYYLVNDMKHFD